MFSQKVTELAEAALAAMQPYADKIDRTAFINQKKVLDAFRELRISDAHFAPSSGYGYNDRGRDDLERVYARIFGTEAALVRSSIISGTHALTIGLFGLLRPGDLMFCVTGKPYDTLDEVIGIRGSGNGSLMDYGVRYKQAELKRDGSIDLQAIGTGLASGGIKVVYIQRSRGYASRPTLSIRDIASIVSITRELCPEAFVVVDNCYGEFVEEQEPSEVGADLTIGSLIKNPGGGIAENGGYLVGSERAVELASYRMTSPGIGAEAGASLGSTKNMYKGLFFAPHVVAQALKTAIFAAYTCEQLGYEASPRFDEMRYDIIQSIKLGKPDALKAFCRGIQMGAPIDSFATPEPWDMPGYDSPVIMAAGAFTQGSSIELSADAPMREPYDVFMQGGLTFESGRLGVMYALEELLRG